MIFALKSQIDLPSQSETGLERLIKHNSINIETKSLFFRKCLNNINIKTATMRVPKNIKNIFSLNKK